MRFGTKYTLVMFVRSEVSEVLQTELLTYHDSVNHPDGRELKLLVGAWMKKHITLPAAPLAILHFRIFSFFDGLRFQCLHFPCFNFPCPFLMFLLNLFEFVTPKQRQTIGNKYTKSQQNYEEIRSYWWWMFPWSAKWFREAAKSCKGTLFSIVLKTC